jgi:Na+-translocating ferredoxin:NAD+ oxidoreductase RnfC subunit
MAKLRRTKFITNKIQMNLAEKVRQAGVVGAGGGGFPTHVKLNAKAKTVIANGAECEPLLHKDAVIMEESAAELVRGIQLAMEAVGAKEGVIGIKGKKKNAVAAVQAASKGTNVRVQLLGDYYPAGDEYDLVYNVTGKLIPPGVETFVNIAAANDGKPLTHKMLTIAGAVKSPATMKVPIGITFRECIEYAGGLTTDDPVMVIGGLMMGTNSDNLDTPVTKTSTGVVVLPRTHHVIERKLKPAKSQAAIGKSACDQCRYCTEYCPRFLLGYAVEPHQVMRTLAFSGTGEDYFNQWAAMCCSCGLCTLYACPEELFPKEACDDAKSVMRAKQMKWTGPMNPKPHAMMDGRRVPIKTLAKKLHVLDYDLPAPLVEKEISTNRLILPLKQSAGTACISKVKTGERVSTGQIIGEPAPNQLGAILHAPMSGTVREVNDKAIVLEK